MTGALTEELCSLREGTYYNTAWVSSLHRAQGGVSKLAWGGVSVEEQQSQTTRIWEEEAAGGAFCLLCQLFNMDQRKA